jgi:hypothetical protein
LFKILASLLILRVIRLEPLRLDITELSWPVLLICVCWVELGFKFARFLPHWTWVATLNEGQNKAYL